MGDITHNFSWHEFRCRGTLCCAGTSAPQIIFVHTLQKVRDFFGVPIYINRGFSCIIYNKEIGGVVKSWHVKGGAVDIKYPEGIKTAVFVGYLKRIKLFGCVILYDTHIHIDIRERLMGRSLILDKRTQPKRKVA